MEWEGGEEEWMDGWREIGMDSWRERGKDRRIEEGGRDRHLLREDGGIDGERDGWR